MEHSHAKRICLAVMAVCFMGLLFGCAGLERNTNMRAAPYLFIHKDLQDADRAVESARMQGKDKQCPAEFQAAEDQKNKAYDVYRACHTEEALAMAREATAKANALCPPVAAVAEPPLEPLPAAEPTPGRYKYCVTLHIEFDINKAVIRPEYNDEIARVGDFMKKYPDTSAIIEGHTDNVGTAEHNMELSQQRAESVVNYLEEKFGIDRSRLTAKGYGMSHPIADNATDAGRQQNRRIEAIIDCAFDVKEAKPPEKLCMTLQVQFDTDSAAIKPQYRDEIAKVADYMKKYPETTALIEGHTDNVGGLDYNMKLSQNRAESVVNELVNSFGIERTRLSAKGYGYTRRVAYNSTAEGRQQNRRINVILDCVIKK
jgi:outer membrane protein OmpA-like peptidoglycan-associated protein